MTKKEDKQEIKSAYQISIQNLSDPNGYEINFNGRFTKEELIKKVNEIIKKI